MTTQPDQPDHVSARLLSILKQLGDDYGPAGVVAACWLLWPDLNPVQPIPSATHRTDDQPTSNTAGDRKATDDVGRFSEKSLQGRLLLSIRRQPGTAQKVTFRVTAADGATQGVSRFEGARRRVSDLVRAGYIEDSGLRDTNPGSPDEAIVWRITPAGRIAAVNLEATGWSRP